MLFAQLATACEVEVLVFYPLLPHGSITQLSAVLRTAGMKKLEQEPEEFGANLRRLCQELHQELGIYLDEANPTEPQLVITGYKSKATDVHQLFSDAQKFSSALETFLGYKSFPVLSRRLHLIHQRPE